MALTLQEARDELAKLEAEVGDSPDDVLRDAHRAVEEVRNIVERYQGGRTGSNEVRANENEVERLLGTADGECEAYYLLNSSKQIIDGLGAERAQHIEQYDKHVQRLGELVLASLKREVAVYPLLDITPTPYDCPSISSHLKELWRIALAMHTEAVFPCNPADIFTQPFEKAFTRHFEMSATTADPTKPELPLRYCLTILRNHWSVMRHLESSSSGDFCALVLSRLGGWLTSSLEQNDRDFFYYTLNEMLTFDESLSMLPLSQDRSLCREVLTPQLTEWWVEAERAKVNGVAGTVRGEECWVPSVPWFLLEHDKWKAGKGAVDVFLVLNALAKKLEKARPKHETVKHFVDVLFNTTLTVIASCAEDLTTARLVTPQRLGDHTTPLLVLIIALNSMSYLLACVESWRVYPVFCASEVFSDASDSLSLAKDALVKSLAAAVAAPLSQFKGDVVNLMSLYPALHETQFLCDYLKTYCADREVYGPCFYSIEQHMTKVVLPRTTQQCFLGAVRKVSELIEAYGGTVALLHTAAPSSPTTRQQEGFFSRIYSTENQAPQDFPPSSPQAEDSDGDWT